VLLELALARPIRRNYPVNTASQDLPRHLDLLQQKPQHATDYELALAYFLEEFASDAEFIRQCVPDEALHLKAVLGHVAAKALGTPATLEQPRAFCLPQTGFYHCNALVAGRVLLFFYFESLDTGLMALIPGVQGGTEVARFRVTGNLAANPRHDGKWELQEGEARRGGGLLAATRSCRLAP
jgi:hypothetical protein